jgi:dTDP-4-dehydrorhamnose reductase
MASILVTGGAGFIGSRTLAEAFLRRGDSVSILDNFNDYYDPRLKRRNVEALSVFPAFRCFEGDIRDPERVNAVFRDANPTGVVASAAMAGVRPSIEQPALYADVNVMGTMRMLEAARAAGVGRFIFASSSSVYGNREGEPFRETDNVDHPVSPYAATKKAGELLCHSWHHLSGIPVTCLRFFTVYGPRQRPDLAIHKFAGLMRRGEPVTLFGDGSTRRRLHLRHRHRRRRRSGAGPGRRLPHLQLGRIRHRFAARNGRRSRRGPREGAAHRPCPRTARRRPLDLRGRFGGPSRPRLFAFGSLLRGHPPLRRLAFRGDVVTRLDVLSGGRRSAELHEDRAASSGYSRSRTASGIESSTRGSITTRTCRGASSRIFGFPNRGAT